jgi:hypothetical protein
VETTKEKVLRIILAGQPELNEKLDSPELVQLKQRVRLRFHLNALDLEEMSHYIRHRLMVAGSGGRDIFATDTYDYIFLYTGGIPRLVNTLCDTALLAAFGQDEQTVNLATLQAAVAELQWQEYAARTHSNLAVTLADDTAPHARPPVGRVELSLKGATISEAYLVPGRFVIGRTTDNDLQIDSKYVSRHHAQLVTAEEGTVLEDLNSTNGVYLNGKRTRRHKLASGDVVRIGMHELTYFRLEAPAFDDARFTHTSVLPDTDEEPDDENLAAGEEQDDQYYSSSARGS